MFGMDILDWKAGSLAVAAGAFAALAPVEADAARVVYVNTEPVTVQAGMTNDPTMDMVSVNGYTQTDFDGWAGATDEQKQQLLALLKDTSVAFDIEFVLERPDSGTYDMVVFGSADDHTSSFGGACSTQVGLSDCGDANGPAISFAYWGCLDVEDQLDPERVAFHTLGALGYGWGLENIGGVGQIMSGWSNTALRWGESCSNINGANGCTHAECAMGQQNSSADLLANLGARVDDGPPEIVVLEPLPDSDVTEPFDVAIEVVDAFGGITTTLEVVGAELPPVPDDAFPFRWSGLMLGSGPVTLRVTATDADGNAVSTDIPICIGGDCPDETGDGDTGDDETGDDDGEGDGATSGASVEAGSDRGDAGGCAVARPPGTLALLALLLLGLSRRREDLASD